MNWNINLDARKTFFIIGILLFVVQVAFLYFLDDGDGGGTVLAMIGVPFALLFAIGFAFAGFHTFKDRPVESTQSNVGEEIPSSKYAPVWRIIKFIIKLYLVLWFIALLSVSVWIF